MKSPIPVIDLFAGPGGLGEGFSALRDAFGRSIFKIALSIEKEVCAHETLRLRSFFRQFNDGDVPDAYYRCVRREITVRQLYERHPVEAAKADAEAWNAELGSNRFPPHIVRDRIEKSLGGRKSWALIGGPPCQAYSLVGRARMTRVRTLELAKYESDKRHFLYREYLRILATHRPPVFVMENVTGMLSSRIGGDRIIDQILRDLRHPGTAIRDPSIVSGVSYQLYSVVQQPKGEDIYREPVFDPRSFIVECEKYGIPQARHRVIILGVRADLKVVPEPLELHGRPVTLSDVIGDLPSLRSELSRRSASRNDWRSAVLELLNNGVLHGDNVCPALRTEVQRMAEHLGDHLTTGSLFVPVSHRKRVKYRDDWYADPRLGGVCNHEARTHMESDVRRYFFASCYAKVNDRSPVLCEFPKSLLPKHKNVSQGVRGEVFADRFRVQLLDKPASTVTSHIAKDGHYFIHPDPSQCRSLTVREAARLQTFPDNYCFLGPRTSQYQQVGNAVPPLLAHQLAELVLKLLE